MLSIIKESNKSGVTYRTGEGDDAKEMFVAVSTAEQMEESKWRLAVGSSVISHCLGTLVQRGLTVNKIHIFAVAYDPMDATVVQSVSGRVTVTDKDGKTSDRLMVMKGHKVGALIVFRVGPSASNNRPRDYVLTVNNNEIVVGDMVDNKLVSETSTMVQGACNILLHRRNFHRLFFQNNSYGPVVVDSESVDESLDLYLYRKTISAEEKMKIDESSLVADKKMQLHPFSDAWRIVKDSKTMAAMFLFHELRYHNQMPLYRAPLDDESAVPELRKPEYSKLEKVVPRKYFNFAVKIHSPVQITGEITNSEGVTRKQAEILVGDETGTIPVVLTGDSTLESEFSQVGTCMVLRNCVVEISGGALRLRIGQWSKIEKDENLPADVSFDFEVNTEVDLTIRKIAPNDIGNNSQRNQNNNNKPSNNNNNNNRNNRPRQRRSPARAAVKA